MLYRAPCRLRPLNCPTQLSLSHFSILHTEHAHSSTLNTSIPGICHSERQAYFIHAYSMFLVRVFEKVFASPYVFAMPRGRYENKEEGSMSRPTSPISCLLWLAEKLLITLAPDNNTAFYSISAPIFRKMLIVRFPTYKFVVQRKRTQKYLVDFFWTSYLSFAIAIFLNCRELFLPYCLHKRFFTK